MGLGVSVEQEVDTMLRHMVCEAVEIAVQANLAATSHPSHPAHWPKQVECVEGFEFLYDETADNTSTT